MQISNKKNILMICSWLDIEKGLGSFFWEQAALMQGDFNIILCNFKSKEIMFKNIFSVFNKSKIQKQNAPNGIPVYIIEYQSFSFLSDKNNDQILKSRIRGFNKLIQKKKPGIDLIHAQSVFNAGIEAQYYHKITGIPFIITEHNQFSLRGKSKLELNKLNKVLQQSSVFLVVSFDKIRQFATNGIFGDFEVVGNSVDQKLFNSNFSTKKDDLFTLITIGAFDLIKDQKTLLNALKIVDSKIKNQINFKWLGFNGWGRDSSIEVQNLLNEYNYKNIIVELIPSLSRKEIADELKNSDLFLFSSISEGMPVSVLEALACGIPVCSTRCGGVDEIINDSNGTIVQIKDFTAIANFTIKVIDNELVFDKKSISENILKEYGNESFSKKIKNIYLNAIN